MVKGASTGIGLTNLLVDLGMDKIIVRLRTDSSAAPGIAHWLGVGKDWKAGHEGAKRRKGAVLGIESGEKLLHQENERRRRWWQLQGKFSGRGL